MQCTTTHKLALCEAIMKTEHSAISNYEQACDEPWQSRFDKDSPGLGRKTEPASGANNFDISECRAALAELFREGLWKPWRRYVIAGRAPPSVQMTSRCRPRNSNMVGVGL